MLAYRPELADSCSSDSSDEDDDDEGEGGLGRRSGSRAAVSTSPPADGSGSIRHGRLLPRSLSAGWSAFKAAQKAAWSTLWLSSSTSCQLRAVTSSPPGLAFTRFHSTLSRRQSTLLTRLRTGACDLGAYKAHFEPERLLCACAANLKLENTSSSIARSTPLRAQPSFPLSDSNPSRSPTSSATSLPPLCVVSAVFMGSLA